MKEIYRGDYVKISPMIIFGLGNKRGKSIKGKYFEVMDIFVDEDGEAELVIDVDGTDFISCPCIIEKVKKNKNER